MNEKAGPTVYMLCGFVGSGKTTCARRLEADGCTRLSVDETVHEQYGRHGIDYDESEYPAREAEAHQELEQRLKKLIGLGRCVVLDYGFWSKEGRDHYKQLIEEAGGHWRLLYFQTDLEEIRARLIRRNEEGHANALVVNDRMFDEFLTRWHPPQGEGEEVILPQQTSHEGLEGDLGGEQLSQRRGEV